MKLSMVVTATLLGCGGLVIAGVTRRSSPAATTIQSSAPVRCAQATRPEQAGGSLYDLDLHLSGVDGRPLAADRLLGHPVLAAMFFAACPSACPLLIRDLKQTIAQLPEPARADVRILLVSFDPARDTPAVLRDVLQRHDLDPTRWLLAAPPDDDGARVVAGALGIRYRRAADGQFEHTRQVTLLDGAGQVRAQSEDLRTIAAAVPAAVACH
jgi:protein SCO1/2